MEPLAIIGLGCRFPGATDPESFWRLLRDGVDAISEVPADRWDVDALYDPDPSVPGKMTTRYGGFLKEVDGFDPRFFGISPREVSFMDPQQRLLLEVTWEALENAGVPPETLAGTQTGVFIGICSFDYFWRRAGDLNLAGPHTGTGLAHSIAPNRLSYVLDLTGPSIALDTACSSSLVAVHLACQSIWRGESTMALVGGVNIIASPELSVAFSKARMLAPDGRCKTFDAAADGYVRGEGCGMAVIKPLAAAQRDGNTVLALVRGTAANQDGRSNGLTAPKGPAQQAVVRDALKSAGLAPADIGYVEAHGTGTPLGDPIELQALTTVLAPGRSLDQTCVVGSVKSNIGHLEGAAGIAGLMKAVLCLQREEIPPQLHFHELNPHIQLGKMPLVIPTERIPWPAGEKTRYAGVNSFGFGGTNAHVVLEEAPVVIDHGATADPERERPLHLLAASARSAEALRDLAGRFEQWLAVNADALADVCFSANTGRTHFPHRLAVTAGSIEQMRESLGTFASGAPGGVLTSAPIPGNGRGKVAFLFTGQGSQYPGMARQLYDTQPTFRRILDRCDEILANVLERPLLDVLFAPVSDGAAIHETVYTQPALFTVEYALAELWRSWGITPDLLMGHSIGEFVAACVAGVFSMEDGLRLVAERGRLMQALPRNGAMAAVMADEAKVSDFVAPYAGQVDIAAANGPDNTVISGGDTAVHAIVEQLRSQGITCHPLTISHAFHSPLTEPMLDDFERAAGEFQYAPPRISVISNVTGRLMPAGEIPDASYWRRHARQAVRFAAGVQTLVDEGCTVAIEMGPHPVLLRMAQRSQPEGIDSWLPSLQNGRDDWSVILDSLGRLYTRGNNPDWAAFDTDYRRLRVVLPTYPFERESFWVQRTSTAWDQVGMLNTANGVGGARHPHLGRRLQSAHPMYESHLNTTTHPYLNDHRLRSTIVVPGTTYLEQAVAVATETFGTGACVVEDVAFRQVLVLGEGDTKQIQVVASPDGADRFSFHLYSRSSLDDQATTRWSLHMTAKIRPASDGDSGRTMELARLIDDVQARCVEAPVSAFYQELEVRGFQYGPRFQGIGRLWRRDGEALARVQAPPELESETESHALHPALLDACIQSTLATIPLEDTYGTLQDTFVPVSIDRVRVYGRLGNDVWCHAVLGHYAGRSGKVFEADCLLLDTDGRVVAEVSGLRAERLQYGANVEPEDRPDDWLYELEWRPAVATPLSSPSTEPGSWLIFADHGGASTKLAMRLTERGDSCVTVSPGTAYARLSADHFQIDPARPDDMRHLFAELGEVTRPAWRGFVHLWSLDLPGSGSATPDSLDEAAVLSCGSVLHLIQTTAEEQAANAPRLWLVTRSAQAVGDAPGPVAIDQAPLWGLGRVVAHEHLNLRCTNVDLGPGDADTEIGALLCELLADDRENQVALRGDRRYVARLIRFTIPEPDSATPDAEAGDAPDTSALIPPTNEPFTLEIARPGLIDLALRPAVRRILEPGQLEIRVRAAALNFRDVMKAMGLYPASPDGVTWLGDECAGTVTALGEGVEGLSIGDEVIATAPSSFGSYAVSSAKFVVPMPSALSHEEAVTVPVAFLTALYALRDLGRLERGERVLIHAATGGVGLAAIQVARMLGAEIYATAGSPEKREYLRSVGIEHVMDSRSVEFAAQVMEKTGNRGVDVVLNSLAGPAIPAGMSCLGAYGRFLEIGKLDIYENSKLGLRPFQNNLSFFAIDMERVFGERPERAGALFREIVQLISEGALKPLPHEAYPVEEAVSAFRHMARARHIGKIVLTFPERDWTSNAASDTPSMLHANGSYLITGGLGSLGLTVARWMVEQGAQHVALMGRSEPSEAARHQLEELRQAGAKIEILRADVAIEEQVAAALDQIGRSMPPLRGIVHAAGILDDGIVLQLDMERFRSVMAPKVRGAWNLHTRTADLPLDFFVLFSSTAAILGSPGQANYVAANAFLDALAHDRRASGKPAMSINWGPWAQVGMAAGSDRGGRLALRGIGSIDPQPGLMLFERLLGQDRAQVAVMPIDWQRWSELFPRAAELPLIADLVSHIPAPAPSGQAGSLSPSALMKLEPHERRPLVEAYLQQEVARVMQLDPSRIDLAQPLNMIGLDSLMGIELKNRLEADLSVSVPMASLVEGPNITQLAAQLVDLSIEVSAMASAMPSLAQQPQDGLAGEQAEELLARLDTLSDEEVDSLLGNLLVHEAVEAGTAQEKR